MLSIYGLESQEHKELRPVTCPRCGELNPRRPTYASGVDPLTIEAAMRAEEEKAREVEELKMELAELKELVRHLIERDFPH